MLPLLPGITIVCLFDFACYLPYPIYIQPLKILKEAFPGQVFLLSSINSNKALPCIAQYE